MRNVAFVILSVLTLSCAGQVKTTNLNDKLKNGNRGAINITNPERLTSPFKNEDDEKMFWQIMNNEVDLEKIAQTPTNKLAVILMLSLSYDVPDPIRVQAFNVLMAKSSQMMDPATKAIVERAFDDDKLMHRVSALRLIFEYDVDALAILRHVLNDKTRMIDFILKQEAKKIIEPPSPNQNFKPAPPATAPSEPSPSQRF